MNVFDILYYISWFYLSALISIELIIYDLLSLNIVKTEKNIVGINKAVNYYSNRKGIFFYKITPIFCLLQVITIVANIVLNISEFWISPILLLILVFLIVVIQTKKNVQVALSLKTIDATNFSEKKRALSSILLAHLITFVLLMGMLVCYSFRF